MTKYPDHVKAFIGRCGPLELSPGKRPSETRRFEAGISGRFLRSDRDLPESGWCERTQPGQCTWSNVMGRIVTLADTTLLQLTEVERRVMQKVALAKLQALNLGVTVRIPSDAVGNSTAHKPKRRAYLLKRKALTTGFFDTARGKDGDKEKGNRHRQTLYIPLSELFIERNYGNVDIWLPCLPVLVDT
uniref:Uncharacterized protein n=2 Tax=Timema TaxID=61471 RepID=A0A7R9AQ51_TIMSH|nr:unnamed protein product [Timema shepardi]CAD7568141.1 unnamed protein product [Timema californicum]